MGGMGIDMGMGMGMDNHMERHKLCKSQLRSPPFNVVIASTLTQFMQ